MFIFNLLINRTVVIVSSSLAGTCKGWLVRILEIIKLFLYTDFCGQPAMDGKTHCEKCSVLRTFNYMKLFYPKSKGVHISLSETSP